MGAEFIRPTYCPGPLGLQRHNDIRYVLECISTCDENTQTKITAINQVLVPSEPANICLFELFNLH